MNPHGRIPVIDDGGTFVWESHSILRYLAARYGRPGFWHEDPAEQSRADRWMDWSQTTLQPTFLNGVFRGYFRTPPEQRDTVRVEQSIAQCAQHFQALDAALAAQPFRGRHAHARRHRGRHAPVSLLRTRHRTTGHPARASVVRAAESAARVSHARDDSVRRPARAARLAGVRRQRVRPQTPPNVDAFHRIRSPPNGRMPPNPWPTVPAGNAPW